MNKRAQKIDFKCIAKLNVIEINVPLLSSIPFGVAHVCMNCYNCQTIYLVNFYIILRLNSLIITIIIIKYDVL